MSHYQSDSRRVRFPDPADQWADWLTRGRYTKVTYEAVPIAKVRHGKWSEDRYERALAHMMAGRRLDPVSLAKVGGAYEVADGNHRVAASAEMGYTHVPALVHEEMAEAPPGSPPPGTRRKMVEEEFGTFLNVLRRFVPAGLEVSWKSVSENGYVADVSFWTPWLEEKDYQLEVRILGDGRREATFKRPGGSFRRRFDEGGPEAFARAFGKWLGDFVEDHPEFDEHRREAMDGKKIARELVEAARELAADQFDHPRMEEALDVLTDASPGLHAWLRRNTRLGPYWEMTYKSRAGMSSSLDAGLGAVQDFYAKEERMRGGDFWKVRVYANVDGEVIVKSSMAGDRYMFKDVKLKWADLKNPAKVFSRSRLPR